MTNKPDYLKYDGRKPEPPYPTESEREEAMTAPKPDAQLEAWRETWTDEKGNTWHRPTAWAYAQSCRVREEQRQRAEQSESRLAAAEKDGPRLRFQYSQYVRNAEAAGFNPLVSYDEWLKAIDAHMALDAATGSQK